MGGFNQKNGKFYQPIMLGIVHRDRMGYITNTMISGSVLKLPIYRQFFIYGHCAVHGKWWSMMINKKKWGTLWQSKLAMENPSFMIFLARNLHLYSRELPIATLDSGWYHVFTRGKRVLPVPGTHKLIGHFWSRVLEGCPSSGKKMWIS